MTKYFYDDNFKDTVADSYSCREVLRKMGWSIANSSYQRFHKWVKEYELDTSHFRKNGPPGTIPSNKRTDDEVFVYGKEENGNDLKKRLYKLGFDKECSKCHLTEWLGLPIMLELDHIDGVRINNELSNLRLLCPNCHSQTDTYRGRNIRKIRVNAKS